MCSWDRTASTLFEQRFPRDNRPRTRIVLDLPVLPGSRRLLGPGNVVAKGMPTDLSQGGVPDAQRRMWIDTVVLEEPVITATTALVRVDGPWRFPLPIGVSGESRASTTPDSTVGG